MGGKNREEFFIKDMEAEPDEVIGEVIANIDAEKSECFVPEDKERLSMS